MKKIGFNNQKYLEMQSEHIKERISQFGDNYIGVGGNYLMIIMLLVYYLDFRQIQNYKC